MSIKKPVCVICKLNREDSPERMYYLTEEGIGGIWVHALCALKQAAKWEYVLKRVKERFQDGAWL